MFSVSETPEELKQFSRALLRDNDHIRLARDRSDSEPEKPVQYTVPDRTWPADTRTIYHYQTMLLQLADEVQYDWTKICKFKISL